MNNLGHLERNIQRMKHNQNFDNLGSEIQNMQRNLIQHGYHRNMHHPQHNHQYNDRYNRQYNNENGYYIQPPPPYNHPQHNNNNGSHPQPPPSCNHVYNCNHAKHRDTSRSDANINDDGHQRPSNASNGVNNELNGKWAYEQLRDKYLSEYCEDDKAFKQRLKKWCLKGNGVEKLSEVKRLSKQEQQDELVTYLIQKKLLILKDSDSDDVDINSEKQHQSLEIVEQQGVNIESTTNANDGNNIISNRQKHYQPRPASTLNDTSNANNEQSHFNGYQYPLNGYPYPFHGHQHTFNGYHQPPPTTNPNDRLTQQSSKSPRNTSSKGSNPKVHQGPPTKSKSGESSNDLISIDEDDGHDSISVDDEEEDENVRDVLDPIPAQFRMRDLSKEQSYVKITYGIYILYKSTNMRDISISFKHQPASFEHQPTECTGSCFL